MWEGWPLAAPFNTPLPICSLTSHLSSSNFALISRRDMTAMSLSIDAVVETTEGRIRRLISENPVVIFSRASCCMCHVMRRLLAHIGVHPTVIELDDSELDRARMALEAAAAPAVFIGGDNVGGLESLVALHVSGRLVPKLMEVGAY